jgi:iron-sulfur cluster assembly protein
MAYVLEFVDKLEAGDQVFENQGVKIVVGLKSLAYIDGTEMDFVKQGVNEGFEFSNPNAKGECGCGESFSV